MVDWLGVRAGETVRYIAMNHIIDVTFTMDGPDARGDEHVLAATIRVAIPSQKPEVISSRGEAARDLYRQILGAGG